MFRDAVQIAEFAHKAVVLILISLLSFTPSDMNFKTILMPKVILANFLSQKKYTYNKVLVVC